jgi:hypothetical protein
MAVVRLMGGGRLLIAVVVLAGVVLAEWARREEAVAGQECRQEQIRGTTMDTQVRDLIARSRRKERVASLVLAGRLTLLEAAAHFRALNHMDPPIAWDAFRRLPGESDDERHCYQVIIYVEAAIGTDDTESRKAIGGTLRTELRQHVGRGTLWLPEVSCPGECCGEGS